MAINLLDDEHGINEQGWIDLKMELIASEHIDIVNAVSSSNGRYYLGETDAEELRNVVE